MRHAYPKRWLGRLTNASSNSFAGSGTVSFTSVGDVLTGTFDVNLATQGHFTGEITAPVCAGGKRPAAAGPEISSRVMKRVAVATIVYALVGVALFVLLLVGVGKILSQEETAAENLELLVRVHAIRSRWDT